MQDKKTDAFVLEAKKREKVKKEACKKYRKEGLIPAVMYGYKENVNVLIDYKIFNRMYHKLTRSTIVNLNIDGKAHDVLIKDYDKDHLKDQFLHIDFYEIDTKKPIHVTIPLDFTGSAIGIREGGLLEKHIVSVDVECLSKDIVTHFDVSISELKIGESLHIRDLKLDKKYKVITNPEEVIVRISGVKAGEETVKTTEGGETA